MDKGSKLVVGTAVRSLHFEHPVKLVAALVQDVRNVVAGFGNVKRCLEALRKQLIGIQEMTDCNGSRRNISAEVSGIVPAAGHVKVWRIRSLVHIVLQKNGILGMTGSVCISAGIFFCQCTAAALEIKTFAHVPLKLFINIFGDGEGKGLFSVSGKDIIAAGLRQRRKIKCINVLARACIDSGIGAYTVKDRMLCGAVDHLEITGKGGGCDLSYIRQIAKLVHINSHRGSS